jgi:hypothetical protein
VFHPVPHPHLKLTPPALLVNRVNIGMELTVLIYANHHSIGILLPINALALVIQIGMVTSVLPAMDNKHGIL